MNHQLTLFTDANELASDVPSIKGMSYATGVLSPEEQAEMLRQIDEQPWRYDLKRRVQHYGYRYDYKLRRVDESMFLGPLPAFSAPISKRLLDRGLIPKLPDQLIINEYLPGQGIAPHVDCEPCFDDTITMLSLGWPYEMEYVHIRTEDVHAILLEPGSALVIAGEARYDWSHQIRARKSDRGIPRQRRVSLTFRNVILCDVQRV